MPEPRNRSTHTETERRSLRDQELLTLVELAPDIIVRVDTSHRLLYANRQARELLGLEPGEVALLPVDDAPVPRDVIELWKTTNAEVWCSGRERTIEFEFQAGDDIRWFQSRTVPVTEADGEVTSVLAISRDITELKRIEEELRDRSEQLTERIKELGCLYDVSRMLQGSHENLDDVLQEVVDAIPAGWQYPEITAVRLRIDGLEVRSPGFVETPWVQSQELELPDGSDGRLEVAYLEQRPHREEDPFLAEERELIRALAGQIVQAVRRRRTERALARSERTFRALIESNRDMVSIAEPDATVRFVSSAVEDILGYTPDEQAGRSLLDCAHPGDAEQLRATFERIVREPGYTPTVVFRGVRKDGRVVHLESRAVNLVDDPAIGGIVVNTRDITARTLAERHREKLEDQLRHAHKMEAVGRLAGGVAHDFNNLLTVIQGHAELLLADSAEDDPRRQSAVEIRRSADRAAELTRQLLAFGRRQVLRPRLLDVNRVIRDLESMLRRVIGEHIELVIDLDERIGPVHADPGQIEQVIVNLAINARDAMETGGRLTIATGSGPPSPMGGRPAVALSVTDTGAGMTPEVRDQLFEPFFTTKEQGSGLGLATVYGIVQQSDGEITVDTAPGAGTSFHILFPSAEGEPAESSPAVPREPTRGSGTVLVVENEDAVRALTARILERAGYRVVVRPCGLEALELLDDRGETIDLLLTDLVMPSMNGYELARRVGELRPDLPVLYMSGYPREALKDHGVPEEEIPLLQKPFRPEALIGRVGEALQGTREGSRG